MVRIVPVVLYKALYSDLLTPHIVPLPPPALYSTNIETFATALASCVGAPSLVQHPLSARYSLFVCSFASLGIVGTSMLVVSGCTVCCFTS